MALRHERSVLVFVRVGLVRTATSLAMLSSLSTMTGCHRKPDFVRFIVELDNRDIAEAQPPASVELLGETVPFVADKQSGNDSVIFDLRGPRVPIAGTPLDVTVQVQTPCGMSKKTVRVGTMAADARSGEAKKFSISASDTPRATRIYRDPSMTADVKVGAVAITSPETVVFDLQCTKTLTIGQTVVKLPPPEADGSKGNVALLVTDKTTNCFDDGVVVYGNVRAFDAGPRGLSDTLRGSLLYPLRETRYWYAFKPPEEKLSVQVGQAKSSSVLKRCE
jgi:hypothetical protein